MNELHHSSYWFLQSIIHWILILSLIHSFLLSFLINWLWLFHFDKSFIILRREGRRLSNSIWFHEKKLIFNFLDWISYLLNSTGGKYQFFCIENVLSFFVFKNYEILEYYFLRRKTNDLKQNKAFINLWLNNCSVLITQFKFEIHLGHKWLF